MVGEINLSEANIEILAEAVRFLLYEGYPVGMSTGFTDALEEANLFDKFSDLLRPEFDEKYHGVEVLP